MFDDRQISLRLLGVKDVKRNGEKIVKDNKTLIFYEGDSFEYSNTRPSDQVNLSNLNEVEKYCNKFLSNLGFSEKKFRLYSYKKESEAIQLQYVEQHRGYLIFSNEIIVVVSQNGITNLNFKFSNLKGFDYDEKIVPAYEILLRHYVKGNEVITNIDIGFDLTNLEKGKSYSSKPPIWRIKTSDGAIRSFNAADGSEIFDA